jgi:uncharacterized protein YecT (DUF1311 family)
MKRSKATDRDALATVFAAWVRHRDSVFVVDPNATDRTALSYPALQRAQDRGWIWFRAADRAVITVDGKRALAPFGVRHEGA